MRGIAMKKAVFLMVLVTMWLGGRPLHAYAESAISLPIRTTLLQCGKRAELETACRNDQRCCTFLDGETVARLKLEQNESSVPLKVAVLKGHDDEAQSYHYFE